jgi:hypothetical protein
MKFVISVVVVVAVQFSFDPDKTDFFEITR